MTPIKAGRVDIDRHDFKTLPAEAGLQLIKRWHLLPTGHAPGRPQIQQSDPPAKLGQIDPPPLAIDKVYESPQGWTVGQNNAGGCLAAASYKDGTTVWIGFDRDGRTVLAFTNAAWRGVTLGDRKSTRLNSSHRLLSRMPSSA